MSTDNSNINFSNNSIDSSAISIGENARAVVNRSSDVDADRLRASIDTATSALSNEDGDNQSTDIATLAAARDDLDAGRNERAKQKVIAFLASAGASMLAGSVLEGLRAAVGR